jgi:hypothetical protein
VQASQAEHGIGASGAPMSARAFHSALNDVLDSALNRPASDWMAFFKEGFIKHPVGIILKISCQVIESLTLMSSVKATS